MEKFLLAILNRCFLNCTCASSFVLKEKLEDITGYTLVVKPGKDFGLNNQGSFVIFAEGGKEDPIIVTFTFADEKITNIEIFPN